MNKVLTFSDHDIKKLISMPECIKQMSNAFQDLSSGKASVPQRINMPIKEVHAQCLFMPVHSDNLPYYGIKNVGIHFKNPDKGLPLIHAQFFLYNATNGQLLALMDAEYITAIRTGAASALASQLLANKNSKTLAIFGTGKQAYYQIEAIKSAFDLRDILIFYRNKDKAEEFIKSLEPVEKIRFHLTKTETDLKNADIICTATNSFQPVFSNHQIKKQCHINGIGSFTSEMAEIPPETIKESYLVVDEKKSALSEAGDIIQAIRSRAINKNHIQNELGELLSKPVNQRESLTVFKSVGNAIQDLYTATYIYKKYLEITK